MPSRISSESMLYSRPSTVQAAADAIPILVDDEYQVFHLTTPPNTVRHPPRLRSTWGRLRSKDLVHWKRDEIEALYPGKNADSPDADGAWTGCAIVGPEDKMHIFYTGYNLANGGQQVILHARSNDREGTAFTKPLEQIAINGDRSKFEDIDFRDAHVSWNEPEKCYWMLVATRLREGPFWTRGCLALLTSLDLERWTIDPEPFYAPNDMFCPECPEIFSLPNGKWYLVYSRFHAPNAGTVYRIADSPRGPFRAPRESSGGRFDARRWYAAKSCMKADDPSRRIYFGWIADKIDGQWSWGGDMGIPREVSADDNGHLLVRPSQEFLEARFSPADDRFDSPEMTVEAAASTTIHFLPVQSSDFCFRFSIATSNAASFGVAFQTDEDMAGYRLKFVPVTSRLAEMTLFKAPPPLDDFWADQYDLHLPREVDGPEIARHIIDVRADIIIMVRSRVLEIFCSGKSISHRLVDLAIHGTGNSIAVNRSNKAQDGVSEIFSRRLERELGIFVEDGALVLRNVSLSWGR